jgi:hypothetical protein
MTHKKPPVPVKSDFDDEDPALAWQKARSTIIEQLGLKFAVQTTRQRQQELHILQDTVGAMQHIYRNPDLEFKALNLAYQSLRLAWYCLEGSDGGKLEYVQDALDDVKRHLEDAQ